MYQGKVRKLCASALRVVMCEKLPAYWRKLLFTSPDLYAPPLHLVPTRVSRGAAEAILAALGRFSMHDPGYELPRIFLRNCLKVPEVPETRAHKAPKPSLWGR